MDDERNLGVTEGRFALTILTCLLVAIGYVALLRWGGTKDPNADISPDDPGGAVVSEPAPEDLKPSEPTPKVLPLEPDNGRPGLAERPERHDPDRR